MKVLDSGSRPLDSGFQLSGFRNPYHSGFQIPNHCGFRIQVSGFGFQQQKFAGFRILLHGAKEIMHHESLTTTASTKLTSYRKLFVAAAFFGVNFYYILVFFPFLHYLCNRVVITFLHGSCNQVLIRFSHLVSPLFYIFYFVLCIAKFTSVLSNLSSSIHHFP